MPQQPIPDWMKLALDGRFNELARSAGLMAENEELRRKHKEIEARLKQELPPPLFQLFLEMEEVLNFRSALEKERLYLYGIRDGMRVYKYLLDFIENDF